MMKYFLTAFSLMFLAQLSHADDEVLQLEGRGIDGKTCTVKVLRDGETLKSVELTGASKIFEILSENEGGYGPSTRISERGGEEVLELLQSNPQLYEEMKISNGVFTNTTTYSLDTSDLPRTDEDVKGIKAKINIKLKFQDRRLSKVTASFKGKYSVITLASSLFECSK